MPRQLWLFSIGVAEKIEEVSMGKSLLTDEMIERANRGEKFQVLLC